MNEQQTRFSGVFVPREVLLDSDISANGKLIFAIIQSLDNDRGCFASNEYIGAMLGLSESSVRSSIGDLERKRYITRVVDENNLRTIKTCVTTSLEQARQISSTPQQISSTPPPENKRPPRQKSGTYSNKDINRDLNTLLLPALPHGEEFAKAWVEWVTYRKESKKPLTPSTIKIQIQNLTQLNEHDAITSIRQSIQHGWSGLFAPSTQSRKQTSKPLTSRDHETF